MPMCSLGCQRVPALSSLCLQWWVAHGRWGVGCMNMQQVASAHPRTLKHQLYVHVQMFADKHKNKDFTEILWCFPKICSSLSPDRYQAGEAAPGRGNSNMKEVLSTRRWVCFFCFCVRVAALHRERGTCAALQHLARNSRSYYACWQDWER